MRVSLTSLLVVLSLAMQPLKGAIIGHVEYSTTNDARKWKVARHFQTTEGEITLYVLDGKSLDDWKTWDEIFSVQTTRDKLSLPALLQQSSIYGFGVLEYKILEENAQGLLAAWWTSGEPRTMHGWVRCLPTCTGTTCLQYMTTNKARLAWAEQVWEPTLRAAKVIE